MPSIDPKASPFHFDPADYEPRESVAGAVSAVPASTYPKSADQDRLPDPRGTWEESFFFAQGAPVVLPPLPRRGAIHLLVMVERADALAAAIVLRIPRAQPDAGDAGYDSPGAGVTNTQFMKGYGPGFVTVPGTAGGSVAQMPIPPLFRIGLWDINSGTFKVAPAGGVWIKAIGIGPAQAAGV